MTPTFFTTSSAFRAWLAAHHAATTELTVGFHKLGSGNGGLTYPRALDEALCFGWIDGVRRSMDAHSYTIRFTPRRPRSVWSLVNLRHVERLQKSGLMASAGLKAFAARDPARSGIYSFENPRRDLAPAEEKKFRAAKKAWAFFEQQAPWYRRTSIWWVISAKQAETRARRLAQLIEDSAHTRRLRQLSRPQRQKPSKKQTPI